MFIFDSQSEFFRYPQGAIKEGEKIIIKIYIKRNIVASPHIVIEKRKDFEKEFYKEIKLEWISLDKNYDLFIAEFQ